MAQNSSTILMVRPANFQYNAQTAASNDYQNDVKHLTQEEIKIKAQKEHDNFVSMLREKGVNVEVVEDTESPVTPDAVFPNNWISMHTTGEIYLYPMKNENRAAERRKDIVQMLEQKFVVNSITDMSHFEKEGLALEGTGSIVFDHINQTAYACISPRTDKEIFEFYCKKIGYQPVIFHAYDHREKLIYHTNVVMCVGDGFVVIGLCAITDKTEREMLLNTFKESKLEVIDISSSQLNENFAGNMLQVCNDKGEKFLVMSHRAYESLDQSQKDRIYAHTDVIAPPVYLIEEIGGGSARCMMAEVFLEKR
jgi:hypothetical protein